MVYSAQERSIPTEQDVSMTTTLAYSNGRISFLSGRPMKASNPYRKGSRGHDHFVRGYVDTEVAGNASDRRAGMEALQGRNETQKDQQIQPPKED